MAFCYTISSNHAISVGRVCACVCVCVCVKFHQAFCFYFSSYKAVFSCSLTPAMSSEWLQMLGPPRSGEIPSLILDGAPLPHSRVVCHLGVFLDPQRLLNEQVVAVAKRALHSFIQCASCTLS